MAVLEKIRVKFGILISVVIALALLSFIIDPNTISQVASTMSEKYRVGKVNGNSVSYQDFENELNYQNRIFEYMYRRNANIDQEMDYVRNMAWKSFVDRYMFIVNAKKAGIQVGKDELASLLSGDMVSPLISQIFQFLSHFLHRVISRRAVRDKGKQFSSCRLCLHVTAPLFFPSRGSPFVP